jgi:hypothetical protein
MSGIQINVNEITNNKVISESDVWAISFYIRQTYERFTMMVVDGYLSSETKFINEEYGYSYTAFFNPDDTEHLAFADTSLGRNLQLIRSAITAENPKSFILKNSVMSDGNLNGGMDDFLQETLVPCMPIQFLVSSGAMEVGIDLDALHRLLIHYFAVIKLHFGSIHAAPESNISHEHIWALGVDLELFSFREMTLLSGYKTERAVRNLASPSTPAHRQISIVKQGRLTLIEHQEAVRWLQSRKEGHSNIGDKKNA